MLYCGFGHRINNGQGTAVRLYHPGKEGKNLFRGDILIDGREAEVIEARKVVGTQPEAGAVEAVQSLDPPPQGTALHADRCLCVDEKGNVITGDHILYIYGCYMKERGKLLNNTVVTTVMSNFGLYKAFDEQGIGYAKTAVGDKYVYEYMAKNGCRIGGEQSGHIIFSKYASTGDGILTSLKMMEVMLAKKKPMSELAAALKIYPQVLENVRVTDKKAAQDDAAVQAAVKAVAEALGDTGRILVRESGTEPVVRVMVEAPDHDTCQKYVSEVVDVIRDRGCAHEAAALIFRAAVSLWIFSNPTAAHRRVSPCPSYFLTIPMTFTS